LLVATVPAVHLPAVVPVVAAQEAQDLAAMQITPPRVPVPLLVAAMAARVEPAVVRVTMVLSPVVVAAVVLQTTIPIGRVVMALEAWWLLAIPS
jgi:hypothetical protein